MLICKYQKDCGVNHEKCCIHSAPHLKYETCVVSTCGFIEEEDCECVEVEEEK